MSAGQCRSSSTGSARPSVVKETSAPAARGISSRPARCKRYATYAARRALLREALEQAGFRVDHSEGALYLWTTREGADVDCWDLVSWFAERGILVAPG